MTTLSTAPRAIQLFYSYAHKDEALRDELEKHLSILKRKGILSTWHDRRITAGSEWANEIDENLNAAQVILLLISPDFIASEYCYDVEMKRALERHAAREALAIPVILRPVDWSDAPFAKLQAVPRDGKPITLWSNPDEAWYDVAKHIRARCAALNAPAGPSPAPVEPVAPPEPPQHLTESYNKALSLYWQQQWSQAVDTLKDIVSQYPNFGDAVQKLEEARRRRREQRESRTQPGPGPPPVPQRAAPSPPARLERRSAADAPQAPRTDAGDRQLTSLEYLDFDVEVGSGSGREYPLAVLGSPAGEARGTLSFPFDEIALDNRLKDVQIALLRSSGARRQGMLAAAEHEPVRQFGQALFDALMNGGLRDLYYKSRREALQQGKGLRIKLRIQSPALSALPWEFLYDPHEAEFVCLSRKTPIVRYVHLDHPIVPLSISPPLRILAMVATPSDREALDVDREKQRMERVVECLRGLVELVWLEGQTWRALQAAMRQGPWHLFHFTGHGGFDTNGGEGFLVLADEQGRSFPLSATQLGRLLADHTSLRLAVLNACEGARGSARDVFSSAAMVLVRRGIPAVLAMQYEITDRAAVEFARAFYEALIDGTPVDAAVAEARKAISMAIGHTVEWATPVLYLRAPDGALFTVRERPLSGSIVEPQRPSFSQLPPAPPEPPRPAPARTKQFCTSCGARILPDRTFCTGCGRRLAT
jgi:hypothetical protein